MNGDAPILDPPKVDKGRRDLPARVTSPLLHADHEHHTVTGVVELLWRRLECLPQLRVPSEELEHGIVSARRSRGLADEATGRLNPHDVLVEDLANAVKVAGREALVELTNERDVCFSQPQSPYPFV